MRLLKYVVYFFVLILPIFHCQNNYNNTNLGRCGKVHITVSALQGTFLELNWVTKCNPRKDVIPDKIVLYERDFVDLNEDISPRVVVAAMKYPQGYYVTKITFDDTELPGNWNYEENKIITEPGQQCFPYWIVSFRGNVKIDLQCLRISPTWMSDNSQRLGSQRIARLLIPGTHGSGAIRSSFLDSYIACQDRDVWTQLVFGIRYFDFRIGSYHEGFYINHDVVPIIKLETVLKVIRKFAELAPKEIIIIDLHRFPHPQDFHLSIHEKLVALLVKELGDFAIEPTAFGPGVGPTLNDIWNRKKNIIISYNNDEVVGLNNWLWYPLHQYWGEKHSVEDLKRYMNSTISTHRPFYNPIWSLMAELTPNIIDILTMTNNLRSLADRVNRHVTKWFRDEFKSNVNVVATDFFLGNDIINIAIDRNVNRKQ